MEKVLRGPPQSLTETLQDSLPSPLVAAMLLQAGQPADTGEAQLLVDEEEEDGQRHDEDAHGGQEADGLRGDWQQEGEGERTHNDTLIRQHKQTAWIYTHTHTVRMVHVSHTDRTRAV